jgi:hypothetical protein
VRADPYDPAASARLAQFSRLEEEPARRRSRHGAQASRPVRWRFPDGAAQIGTGGSLLDELPSLLAGELAAAPPRQPGQRWP